MTYQLHSVIQQAYLDVHDWLVNIPRTKGYIDIKKPCPDKVDLIHVAAQFATYFPTHHFKNVYALNQICASDAIRDQLQRNSEVVLVDIGCGGGAASAALVSTLLQLQADEVVRSDIKLMCVGVDPAENVLGTYSKFMEKVKQRLPSPSLSLDYRVVDRPVSESVTDLDEHLQVLRTDWNQPALPHVFLMQSNVVWPLDRVYVNQQERHDKLSRLGITADVYLADAEFGMRESRSYRQLFRQLPIDNLYTVTVGTNKGRWSVRVDQMGASLAKAFRGHAIQQISTGTQCLSFFNPEGSFWWKLKSGSTDPVRTSFPLDIKRIQNTGLDGDLDWNRVIAVENLELAWARARALLQREVVYDEIEIRLFERNLDANLKRLHQELVSYDTAVARTSDRLQFRFVKNDEDSRPLVQSRIEEQIVSIAIVQELGAAAFGLNAASYAYRPNPRFASRSEFLYEYWFPAYQLYKEQSRNSVAKHTDCKVLTIDIKSYFTEIPQQPLVESVQREIRTQSARIRWLLQRLLCEELDPDKPNHGLSQGGAGSGFYANAYLTKFDSSFGINNLWEAHLFRFVDDIVIVIPTPNHLDDLKSAAIATLTDIGLQANEDKSEAFDQDEYLNLPQDEGVMSGLSERFDDLTKPLWRANRVIREQLRKEDSWWPTVGVYRDHLHSIGHYIEPHRLSRKLYQYVEKHTIEQEEGGKDQDEFKLPSLGNPTWAEEFTTANDKWIKNRECLRAELFELAKDSYGELSEVTCDKQKRILSTRIYFSANRLARLGFGDSVELLTNILISQPWIIRQPQYVIRGLAIQGFSSHLENLFDHYKALDNNWSSSFLAVIVRAIRHLSEVPESLEDGIIQLAIDDGFDQIARLLATETWLMKLDCARVAKHRSKIQVLIASELNSRVRKNYLLLLAKCANESVPKRDYEDPLMTRAMEVAMTGSMEELFDYVEPSLLRERYYSTYFPSHMDFDDESPFSG